MKIFDEITDFKINNSAVTLGKFDGLHLGHRVLIEDILDGSKKYGYKTVLFSFDTSAINGQSSITTKTERNHICMELGIEHVIYYPVNSGTMAIEPEEFIKNVLVDRLDVKRVVTGEDFRFGKKRRGDVSMLRKYSSIYGYELIVEKSVSIDGIKAGSTSIKEYIKEGRINKANEMLGYPYFIMGEVIKGNQIGRTMDARTVNIHPPDNKMLPPYGVYKTSVTVEDKKYKSITNIGLCPTVRSDSMVTAETHIFDFEKDIYGDNIKVEFEKFIRYEKKFDNIEELKRQIALDISEANL